MAAPKKAPVKVNENGEYIDIFPETYADVVYLDDARVSNVFDALGNLDTRLEAIKKTANAAAILKISSTEPPLPTENMIWIKP